MNSYLYAKWKNAPHGSPTEFYSELDHARWELRKVEVFADGRTGYASVSQSSNEDTRLAIVALPPLDAINQQVEFEAKLISPEDFEAAWRRATT